jgi:hypothetical protein
MKRTRSVARAEAALAALYKSPYEELPGEMRAEIRNICRGHHQEHVFRIKLQRVCKLFHADDSGLILPCQLESSRDALPVHAPDFHHFLREMYEWGFHLEKKFHRMVDVTAAPPRGDSFLTELHHVYGRLPFAVAMEYSLENDYFPIVILATRQPPTTVAAIWDIKGVSFGRDGRAIRGNKFMLDMRAPYPNWLMWSRVVPLEHQMHLPTKNSWFPGVIARHLASELNDIASFSNDDNDSSDADELYYF